VAEANTAPSCRAIKISPPVVQERFPNSSRRISGIAADSATSPRFRKKTFAEGVNPVKPRKNSRHRFPLRAVASAHHSSVAYGKICDPESGIFLAAPHANFGERRELKTITFQA
jgi:hypothetical protein